MIGSGALGKLRALSYITQIMGKPGKLGREKILGKRLPED
jgi:hypothetical protein